jgi:hypothetical protein
LIALNPGQWRERLEATVDMPAATPASASLAIIGELAVLAIVHVTADHSAPGPNFYLCKLMAQLPKQRDVWSSRTMAIFRHMRLLSVRCDGRGLNRCPPARRPEPLNIQSDLWTPLHFAASHSCTALHCSTAFNLTELHCGSDFRCTSSNSFGKSFHWIFDL